MALENTNDMVMPVSPMNGGYGNGGFGDNGCCETVSIRNTSDQPILVQNANVIFARPDLQNVG